MTAEIQVNNSTNAAARFVTWAPVQCRIRLTNTSGATPPAVNVTISGQSAAGGGAVVFRAGTSGAFSNSINVSLPLSGVSVSFFMAGQFGRPSSALGDVNVVARAGANTIGSVPVMVRIRKNANTLSADERNRFVSAFARLNNQGLGRFADFREMHRIDAALAQAHGAPGFLPWHRAYLLDLERELQAIDPSVALHYWRFDQAAPNLFTADFLGVSDPNGTVSFNPANPLQFWRTNGVQGIDRLPMFNTNAAAPGLRTEAQTINLGSVYQSFRVMEGNPHGTAHTRFDGWIMDASTAPRDPLFFLLHCNVDRLWAKWQKQLGRFNPDQTSAFTSPPNTPVGHRLNDTMWPWNGVTGGTRPPTAPGGTLATSPLVAAPGLQPRVRDMIDYQGVINANSRLGFDYDDVRF